MHLAICPHVPCANSNGFNSSLPSRPFCLQVCHRFRRSVAHADDIQPRVRVHHLGHHLLKDVFHMRRHVLVPRNTVLHRINAHGFGHSTLARKRAPAHARYGTAAAAVPDQLAQVGDYDTWIILGRFHRPYEVQSAARGVRFLPDDTVGEDAKVLAFFTEEEDGAGRGGEVFGGENRNMAIAGGGREGKASQAEGGEQPGCY